MSPLGTCRLVPTSSAVRRRGAQAAAARDRSSTGRSTSGTARRKRTLGSHCPQRSTEVSRAKPQRGRAPWDALPVSPARVRLGSHTVWPALHASWSPGAAPLQSGRHAGVLMVRAPLACARGPSTSHRGGLPHRRHSTVQCGYSIRLAATGTLSVGRSRIPCIVRPFRVTQRLWYGSEGLHQAVAPAIGVYYLRAVEPYKCAAYCM